MSHFTVLVIGENVEGQLAPYDETANVTPYPDLEAGTPAEFWMTADLIQEGAVPQNPTMQQVLDAARTRYPGELDRFFVAGESGVVRYDDGQVDQAQLVPGALYRWSTYNPNSKWDWYQIGGRWTGFFELKDGGQGALGDASWARKGDPAEVGTVDIVRKGDVDWELMRSKARAGAEARYDAMVKLTEGLPLPRTWEEVLASKNVELAPEEQRVALVNEARRDYHNQPWVKAMKGELDVLGGPEDYMVGDPDARTKYIQRAEDAMGVPYAVVHQGEWLAQGKMGWFGMSSGEQPAEVWYAKVRELLDSLPDDTLLTLVDCHI